MKKFVMTSLSCLIVILPLFETGHAMASDDYDVRMIPAFAEGKQIGSKVTELKANSKMSKLGFKNGDIITSYESMSVIDDPALVAKMGRAINEGSCGAIIIKRGNEFKELRCK